MSQRQDKTSTRPPILAIAPPSAHATRACVLPLCAINDRNDKRQCHSALTPLIAPRHTKLLFCYHVAKRDGGHTQVFADNLHARITGRPTICSDGLVPYTTIIPETWDGKVNFAQIVKTFVTPPKKEQQKYYPAAIMQEETKEVCGEVERSEIRNSRMERFNLSSRMHVRRLTRLTNAHSNTLANHKAMLALWFAFYNFCRKHMTLKTTPAVAAGIASEPWSLERLLTEAARIIAA